MNLSVRTNKQNNRRRKKRKVLKNYKGNKNSDNFNKKKKNMQLGISESKEQRKNHRKVNLLSNALKVV